MPTRVTVEDARWQIEALSYPLGESAQMAFQQEALQLYTGTAIIKGRLKSDGVVDTLLPLTLDLQACNEKLCLPPERLVFRLPVWQKD